VDCRSIIIILDDQINKQNRQSRCSFQNLAFFIKFSEKQRQVNHQQKPHNVSIILLYLSGEPPMPPPLPGVQPPLNVLDDPGASPNGLLTGVVGPDAGPGVPARCPSLVIGGVSVLSINVPSLTLFCGGGLNCTRLPSL